MKIIAENHSMYPRVGESDHAQRLRQAHHDFDHGAIDAEKLKEIEDSYVEELIKEQEDAGLDVVTDGMIRWYDHISHLCGKISGVEVGGLVRYFDTNYLVREGIVRDRVEWDGSMLVDQYKFAAQVASKPVKVILTGPYTLAYFSEIDDSDYASERELAEDYADLLAREAEVLADSGVEYLQIEEPMLLQNPANSSWVLPLNDKIVEAAANTEVRLATYFGDAAPLYDELQETAVDMLLFDFSYGPELFDCIADRGSDKRIGFGLLDGRNTKLATADELAEKIEAVSDNLTDGPHSVSFTCSLDYLPRDRARLKLERLAETRDKLQEVLN